MEEHNKDQNLPTELEQGKKKSLKIKIKQAIADNNDRALGDSILYTPLKEEKKDESAPLHKGSVDMWFLLWAMLLLCFGAVMSYSASAVYAEQKYDSSTYLLWRYILFAVAASVVTFFFVMFALLLSELKNFYCIFMIPNGFQTGERRSKLSKSVFSLLCGISERKCSSRGRLSGVRYLFNSAYGVIGS